MRVLRERYGAFRAALSPLPSEFAVLRRLALEAYGIVGNILRRYDFLIVAYAVCLVAIVLTNDRNAPRTIYFAAVLPIAFFVGLAFARRVLTGSVVFWAVAAYLLAMGLSSLIAGDVPRHDLSRHFRLIPLILTYLIVVGLLAADGRALRRVLLVSSIVIAVSALINLTVYLVNSGLTCPPIVSHQRLCSVVGMPDYINSTNLSAPYALYAVAAVAVLVQGGVSRTERALFALAAAILLAASILTESRSGLVAAAAGCAVLAATGPRWCRLTFGSLALLIVVLVLALPQLRDLVLLRGMSYRPELWAAYFSKGLGHPLLGVGILENIDVRMRDGHLVDQPHNLVLSAFVRGGIAGAIAMVTAIAGAAYCAVRYWLKTRNVIPLALIATMFGYSMLDYQLLATYPTWPWITFWFPIGVCVGTEMMLRDARHSDAAS